MSSSSGSSSSSSSVSSIGDSLVKSQFASSHHLITSEKLNGKNYASWSTAVQIWFMGQGQEEHLEHSIDTVPTDGRPAWKKLDAQLLAILWQSIDPQYMPIFRAFMTCHDTWTQAKSLFQGDITRAYDIIGNLFQLKQSETDNTTHMGRFQSFATEFRDLLPFTTDAVAYAKKMDELLTIMYLHTIRPELDSVKSSILGSPTIPSLTEVYSRVSRASSITPIVPPSADSVRSALISSSVGHGRGGPSARGSADGRGYAGVGSDRIFEW